MGFLFSSECLQSHIVKWVKWIKNIEWILWSSHFKLAAKVVIFDIKNLSLKFVFLFEKSIAFLHPNLDWLSCFGPIPENFDAVQVAFVVVGKLFLQTLKPSVKVSEIKMFTNYNFYKLYFFLRLGYLVTDSPQLHTYYQQLLQIIAKPM